MDDHSRLEAGDRAPFVCGAFATGGFFSIESYSGATLVLISADSAPADVARLWLDRFQASAAAFAQAGAEPVLMISMGAGSMMSFINPPACGVAITQPGSDLTPFGGRVEAPDVLVIDRNGRVNAVLTLDDPDAACLQALDIARGLQKPPAVRRFAAAPVLIVPDLLPPHQRRALIAAFEAGAHEDGAMASMDADGHPVVKLEAGKKHRRDLVLTPDHPLHAGVVHAIATRLVPEMRRAYQIDIAHADRILIARYDETGGYFHRHRDNSAPHVAFRQFAMSLNLNTGEYEGGDLEFPEFDNDHYSPPAGAAVVFSATLLHAARPVTKGSRYVLLTFLHDDRAEAERQAYETQQADAN